MTQELSAKDKKLKARVEKSLQRDNLTVEARGRRVLGLLPHDPRCVWCLAPFEGAGAILVRAVLNKRRSTTNPLMCNTCDEVMKRFHCFFNE